MSGLCLIISTGDPSTIKLNKHNMSGLPREIFFTMIHLSFRILHFFKINTCTTPLHQFFRVIFEFFPKKEQREKMVIPN